MVLEVDTKGIFTKLDTLKLLAPNFAMEAMSKSGAKLRKAMVSRAKTMGTHSWGKTTVNGYKRITFGVKEKQSYIREGKNVNGKNENLAEFIRFQAYDRKKTVLVGWMNEKKGFRTYRYENGRRSPFTYASGVYVKKIGQKMEYGGRVKLSPKQRSMFRYSRMKTIANRGYVNYKARPIVVPSFNAMRGTILSDIAKSYKEAFAKANSLYRRAG